MAFHTFPVDQAGSLEDDSRYRFCSREELVGALDPSPGDVVADLGSGIGFFTDDVAPFVGTCYAVDVQTGMHEQYRRKGQPDNVEFVTAEVGDLPFAAGRLDAAFSTMTYHEFATDETVHEVHRVLAPGGRFVVVDWSAAGAGESGPPLAERYDVEAAAGQIADAGFAVEAARERPETFLLVATADRESGI